MFKDKLSQYQITDNTVDFFPFPVAASLNVESKSNGNFTKVIGQDNKESLIARPQFSFQYDNIDIYITLTPAKQNWK